MVYRKARSTVETELGIKLNFSECFRLRQILTSCLLGLVGSYGKNKKKTWYDPVKETVARFLVSEYHIGSHAATSLVFKESDQIAGGKEAIIKQVHFVRRKREEDGSL